MKQRARAALEEHMRSRGEGFVEAFARVLHPGSNNGSRNGSRDGSGNGSGNRMADQDREQDQDQDQEGEATAKPAEADSAAPLAPRTMHFVKALEAALGDEPVITNEQALREWIDKEITKSLNACDEAELVKRCVEFSEREKAKGKKAPTLMYFVKAMPRVFDAA
jgi:hypothetical protein